MFVVWLVVLRWLAHGGQDAAAGGDGRWQGPCQGRLPCGWTHGSLGGVILGGVILLLVLLLVGQSVIRQQDRGRSRTLDTCRVHGDGGVMVPAGRWRPGLCLLCSPTWG